MSTKREKALEWALQTLAPCASCKHRAIRAEHEYPSGICEACVFSKPSKWDFDAERFEV
jgi:hypothetical protein